jgi:cysteine desulfurase family protein (TIGR01976 family)
VPEPPPIDAVAVRERFPSLSRRGPDGRPYVFADAPGGTQVPQEVIGAMTGYLRGSNANTGGAFVTSVETDAVLTEARRAAADLIGASPLEVVFGQNMTTLAFALSRSLAHTVERGDEVVLTVLDHDANVAPWLILAQERGATVRWVDCRTEDCTLDLATLDDALSTRTRLVAFTLASNAVGSITAAAEVVRRVRKLSPDALMVADGVHVAQHRLIDVRSLDVDVLFCSAYKFFGPHLGVMFGRRDLLERWLSHNVRPVPDAVPDRWETGTLNHEGLAGLAAAVDYVASVGFPSGFERGGDRRGAVCVGMEAIRRHEGLLSERFLHGVSEIPRVRLFGIARPERADQRTPTFALTVDGMTPRAVAERLAERGVFVWDGNYFALAIMERLGLEASGGAVRIGFCHYNTEEEVDRVLEELARVAGV